MENPNKDEKICYNCNKFENRWVVNKVQMNKSDDICPIHNTLLDADGQCKKCLEENNK